MALRITNKAFLAKVDAWFRSIKPADTVVLIHDKDPDGVCSAAILSRMLTKLRGRRPQLVTHVPGRSAYGPTPALLRRIRALKPDRIITADLGLDSEPGTVRKLARIAPTLVLDHHKVYDRLRFPGVFLVKPQFFCAGIPPNQYCTAKLAYDLAMRVADVREMDWLAIAGLCADQATESWRPWIARIARRHKRAWDLKDPFASVFGKVADRIQLAINGREALTRRAFQVASRASGPAAFLKEPALRKVWAAVRKEIRDWVGAVRKRAEWYPRARLIYYAVKARHHIKPTLSTLLALRYPDWTVVTVSQADGSLGVSARRKDGKVAVNDILQAAVKGIPKSRAGGHRPAAGADIPFRYEKLFKKRLVELLT